MDEYGLGTGGPVETAELAALRDREWSEVDHERSCCRCPACRGMQVADGGRGHEDDCTLAAEIREACADARLRAAAPALLAALRGLGGYVMSVRKTGNTAEWMEGLREKIDAADAAIREATGG